MDFSGYKFPPSPTTTTYANQSFVTQSSVITNEPVTPFATKIEQVKDQLTAQLCQNDGGSLLAQQVKEVLETAESFLQKQAEVASVPVVSYSDYTNVQQLPVPSEIPIEVQAVKPQEHSNVTYSEVPREAYQSIRELVFYIIKSPDFRSFMKDVAEFLLSVLSDANEKHGEGVVNTLDQDLSNIDSHMHGTRMLFTDLKNEIREGSLGDPNLLHNVEADMDNLLLKLTENSEYSKAVNSILMIIDEMVKRFDLTLSEESSRGDVFTDMIVEGYQILGEFTDKAELEEFKIFFGNFFEELTHDETICHFLLDLKTIVLRYIDNPNLIRTEQGRSDFRRFVQYVGKVLRSEQAKHAEMFEELFDRIIIILTGITYETDGTGSSRRNSCVSDDGSFDDVFIADDSMTQLKSIIIPLVKSQLQNITLPGIEGGTNKYEFQFDNLTLSGSDILPDTFALQFENRPGSLATRRQVSKLKMIADGINLSLRDVAYHYKRNRFPSIEDNGIADVSMLGSGLSFKIIWNVIARKDKPIRIELYRVKCSIDSIDITFKKSEHSIINKIAKKIFARTLKKRVAEVVVERFRQELEPLSERLNEFFQRENDSPRFRELAGEQLSQLFDTQSSEYTVMSDIEVAKVVNDLTSSPCDNSSKQEAKKRWTTSWKKSPTRM
jgi:hypothetical protein